MSYIPKLSAFSIFLCMALFAAGTAHAGDNGEEYRIKGFLRPPGLSFPIVFYLSMDHPGPQKAMLESKVHTMAPGLDPDEDINLPVYMGYLVVDNINQATFVSKNSKYPAANNMVDAVIFAHSRQQEKAGGEVCSKESPVFCAGQGTWNAVWVLLNDLWRDGIVVSAYTMGVPPDQYFIPNYKNLRTERQRLASPLYPEEWPEFSNNTYSMKNFQQAWGLPIFADNWAIMGETIKVPSQKPENIKFPLVFYFNLTARGVLRNAPQNESYKDIKTPLYAGYLVVDQTYTYRFTRKSPFNVSLSAMTNQENSLKEMPAYDAPGLYGSRFTASPFSWAGLGLFLSKIVSSGDYEIFAYTSGKSPSYNFSPEPPNQKQARKKDNISYARRLYDNGEMLSSGDFPGLSRFNSIMFFEPDWPERWERGEFKPRHEQEWPEKTY